MKIILIISVILIVILTSLYVGKTTIDNGIIIERPLTFIAFIILSVAVYLEAFGVIDFTINFTFK